MNTPKMDLEVMAKLIRQKQALRVAVCDALAVLNVGLQPGYNLRTIAGEVITNLKLEIGAIDREDADPDFREVDEPEDPDINF